MEYKTIEQKHFYTLHANEDGQIEQATVDAIARTYSEYVHTGKFNGFQFESERRRSDDNEKKILFEVFSAGIWTIVEGRDFEATVNALEYVLISWNRNRKNEGLSTFDEYTSFYVPFLHICGHNRYKN